MNHVKALVMKFVMIAVVMGIIASGIYGAKLSNALWISLVLTIVAYLAGDLLIFRTMFDDSEYVKRNATATIADFVLSFVVIYFMGKGLFVNDQHLAALSFFSAVVIAVGEWFFHRYLDDHVFGEKPNHNRAPY